MNLTRKTGSFPPTDPFPTTSSAAVRKHTEGMTTMLAQLPRSESQLSVLSLAETVEAESEQKQVTLSLSLSLRVGASLCRLPACLRASLSPPCDPSVS